MMNQITAALLDEVEINNCELYVGLYKVDAVGRRVTGTDTIKVVAPTGGVLERVRYKAGIGGYTNFAINSGGSNATRKVSQIANNITAFEITLTEPEPEPDLPTYEIKQSDIDYLEDNFCSIFVNGGIVSAGYVLKTGDVVEILSNVEYLLIGAFWTDSSSNKTFDYIDERSSDSTFNNDGFIDFWNGVTGFRVEVEFIKDEFDTVGSNNIYLIDDVIYTALMSERFSMGGNVTSARDYGTYIVNALLIPMELPLGLVSGEEDIRLGDYATSVRAPLISKDLIEVDLGKIEIVPTNGNLLDYKDVSAKLHLPFSEPIDLDINYVIGLSVAISYLINVYDGTASIKVTSSKTNDVIHHSEIQIGLDVPLANLDKVSLELKGKIKSSLENGINKCFIELITPDLSLLTGKHGAVIEVDGTLDVSGYVVVDNIELKTMATAQEDLEIKEILKSGVYIN